MLTERPIIDYRKGEIYPFTVNGINVANNFCDLVDDNNFHVYLQHSNRYRLTRGQKVRCRVMGTDRIRPLIELVDKEELSSDSAIDEPTVAAIWQELDTQTDAMGFARLLLMVEIDTGFEDQCRQWIARQMEAGTPLTALRDCCTRFMEQTPFLARCNATERERYQQRLTVVVELLGIYIEANRIVADDSASAFVESLFQKLRVSGYVYQPARNFNILKCLFLADKALMENSMGQLFAILRLWNIDMWRKEPFNSVLVGLLQLYIDESAWAVDRVRDNSVLVENLIQALTIQLLLTDSQTGTDDYRLNLSRLATLTTYKFQADPHRTMSLALSWLLGTQQPVRTYSLADTGNPLTAIRLGSTLPQPLGTSNCFFSHRAKLIVDDHGLTLHTSATDQAERPLLPAQLGLWQQLQVMAVRSDASPLPQQPSIKACQQLWTDVEKSLFSSRPVAAPTVRKHKHRIDEQVQIVVSRQDDADPNRFLCHINGETESRGFILIKEDVARYNINAHDEYFRSPSSGHQLVFDARITDIDDDLYHFSMADEIKDWARTYYDEDPDYPDNTRMECWVGSHPRNASQRIPAITRDGISVSLSGLSNPDVFCNLRKGDIVVARYDGPGDGTYHVNGTVEAILEDQNIDFGDAFGELMRLHADGKEEQPQAEADKEKDQEEELQQSDRMLDVAFVRELIRQIDRMAVIDSEYVKSYCYLGFARVLCLMVDWQEQADYYLNRMQLISLLNDFAKNDVVDQQRLADLSRLNAELFQNNALLHNRFLQLQVVSCMNRDDRDEELWTLYTHNQGIVKSLASLVVAYNMLRRNGLDTQAIDLQNRVKQVLRLEGNLSNLKLYGLGIEDKTTEYKTSVVYPSNNQMQPNMEAQMKVILRVIASFLNTDGGTLYIGANDQGMGVGVENDLSYREFQGDRDKYQRRLSDQVAMTWNNFVSTYVDVAFDADNRDKDVLIVTVRPYPDGVSLDGEYFVRTASSTRRLTKDEFDMHLLTRRSHQRAAIPEAPEATATADAAPAAAATTAPAAATTVAGDSAAAPTETPAETPHAASGTIATAPWRLNQLLSYIDEDRFRPYEACLSLLDKGKFSKSPEYNYRPSLIDLAIYDDERDAFLILGYADGTVNKVPVAELLRFDDGKSYARFDDTELLFASIAGPNDGVAIITEEAATKQRTMVRIDLVANYDEGRMTDKGQCLYRQSLAERVKGFGIVPADHMAPFRKALGRSERSLGEPLERLKGDLAQWVEIPE